MVLQYIDEHRFLADYIKPLAKQLVVAHFGLMRKAVGALELTARRTQDEGVSRVPEKGTSERE